MSNGNQPRKASTASRVEKPLRVVLLTDDPIISGWEAFVAEQIATDRRFEIAAVVENATDPMRRRRSVWQMLWFLIDALENKLSPALVRAPMIGNRDIDAKVILGHLLEAHIPYLRVTPLSSRRGWAHLFSEQDIATITALDVDVMLKLGLA